MTLSLLFQSRGILTARELQGELRLGQSRVSRLLAMLGPRLLRMGARRSARYALRREIPLLGSQWPIYCIDEAGKALHWAQLLSLHGGFAVQWQQVEPAWLESADRDGYYPGLPFFLEELRPQGFLGRLIARALADSGRYSPDPRQWPQDDVLRFLLSEGDDCPGNLVVGAPMLERVQRRQTSNSSLAIHPASRMQRYPELAERAAQGEPPTSSAGGEQPKFLAQVGNADTARSVLVKFTTSMATPVGARWADLLLAEWHALETLRLAHAAAATAEIIDAGGRRFLEVERFDRVGRHGRRGVIALSSLEAALLTPAASDWTSAANQLEAIHLIDAATATHLRQLACFGELIGNSDMHLGNIGFWFGAEAPFRLAPTFDMLPMRFAPTPQGEIVRRELDPRPPAPEMLPDWAPASRWALTYWRRICDDPRCSQEFAGIAARCQSAVARLIDRFLPAA